MPQFVMNLHFWFRTETLQLSANYLEYFWNCRNNCKSCVVLCWSWFKLHMKSFPQIEKYEEQINLSSSSKWSVAGLVDNMLLVALERECNMCYSQTCYKCYKITCKSHLALVSNQQLQDVPKNKATNRG